MKKLFIAGCMMVALAACGGNSSEVTPTSDSTGGYINSPEPRDTGVGSTGAAPMSGDTSSHMDSTHK